MPSTSVHASVCILGGGPSALLCNVLLRQNGVTPLLVANAFYGMLSPFQHRGLSFTAIPVFANVDSPLYQRMRGTDVGADPLRVHYVDYDGPTPNAEPDRDSYGAFLRIRYGEDSFAVGLAAKHLGPIVHSHELPELRSKVLRHYGTATPRASRLGFLEGMSPYYVYIQQHLALLELVPERIDAIDLREHTVLTSSRRIEYDRLICTIPFAQFLALARVHSNLRVETGDARFMVLETHDDAVPNDLVYDCRSSSPVYRVFVPRRGIAVVQMARSSWHEPPDAIAQRVRELLGFEHSPRVVSTLDTLGCYPLGVSDYSEKAQLMAMLRSHDVTMFGRFAQWEYRDLDELDWGGVL